MDWTAQPRQGMFLNRLEDEVLYGGAAGGGKRMRSWHTAFGWRSITGGRGPCFYAGPLPT